MVCITVNKLVHPLFRLEDGNSKLNICTLFHYFDLILIVLQTGQKRRVVSFGTSKSEAKASADGNASIVIETSAGHASFARATISVT
jgi:hypothetical protein